MDAIELAASAGLILDDWQAEIVNASLEREGDLWAHFEVASIQPRQNGKGAIIEARELYGLYEDPHCKLIVHSCHEFSTALEAFRRLLELIESNPQLERQVKNVSHSHGKEGIELHDSSRIRYKTRTKAGGRGLSSDLLFLDEAMILSEAAIGALLPTLSARPNPQVWYTGSAVDQDIHEHGIVLSRVRGRGHKGDSSLAFFEHCANVQLADILADPKLLEDRQLWREANPALGKRITEDHVAKELQLFDPRTFAVERLGIGDWPATTSTRSSLISRDLWASLADPQSAVLDPVVFAFDVKRDRGKACIAVSGLRADGLRHVEVIDHRDGTGWVAKRLAELCKRHAGAVVRCDSIGPAASLIAEVELLGVKVQTVSTSEYAQACGKFFDSVAQGKLRHLGTAELAGAVAGASTRPLSESWAWARAKSTMDISPLVACTLAAWGEPKPPVTMFGGFG